MGRWKAPVAGTSCPSFVPLCSPFGGESTRHSIKNIFRVNFRPLICLILILYRMAESIFVATKLNKGSFHAWGSPGAKGRGGERASEEKLEKKGEKRGKRCADTRMDK